MPRHPQTRKTTPVLATAAAFALGLAPPALAAPPATPPIHAYELDGSLEDTYGGPALQANGGTLGSTSYAFGPNEGLTLSSLLPDVNGSYSIEIVCWFDDPSIPTGGSSATQSYQKIIDFEAKSDDDGLYSYNPGTSAGSHTAKLRFYPHTSTEVAFYAGVPVHVVLTRNGATDLVKAYALGVGEISFTDSASRAVFSSNVAHFFQDDTATDEREAGAGTVDFIRIYDYELSEAEVATLNEEALADTDLDTVSDPLDNCPAVANTDQADLDGDTVGDACDPDADGDGCDEPTTMETWYADVDEDGYGDPGSSLTACTLPEGYVTNDADCDDLDDLVNPAQLEVCDGIDNNCDEDTDGADAIGLSTWYLDLDHDDFGDLDNTVEACEPPLDGTTNAEDCDDTDITINPDGIETCNGLDDDCDEAIDEAGSTGELTWYADLDGDTYGDADNTTEACDVPADYTDDAADCDDSLGAVNPAATEVCNLADDDCDEAIDEAGSVGETVFYADADGDGHGDGDYPVSACFDAPDIAESDDDCDDTEAATYPGADEYCNEVDDDCNDIVDDPTAVDATLWYPDLDHDGWGVTRRPVLGCEADGGGGFDTVNFSAASGDCRPTDGASYPGADESCDLVDNDCDSEVDEAGSPGQPSWFVDADADGYGAGDAAHACLQPVGYLANADDCDDYAPLVNPAATESCNEDDDDCDGQIDEAGATGEVAYYLDADDDGFGDPATALGACDPIPGRTDDGTDCDDTSDGTYPGAQERCDGARNDCELTDWSSADEDGEVWLVASNETWTSYTAQWNSGSDGSPAAITLPASGTLQVCDGTYFVNLTASAAGTLEVEGTYEDAVLSGGGAGSVVRVTGSSTSLLLANLTLEDGAGSGSPLRGGGLRVTAGTVEVEDVLFRSNTAAYGGALSVTAGSLAVTDSELDSNQVTHYGGGWHQSGGTLTLTDTDVFDGVSNSAGGGGYKTSGTLSVSGGEYRGNVATYGGAVLVSGSATISGVWIHENTASSDGGGLYTSTGTVTLGASIIEDNTAGSRGGGLFDYSGTVNCTGDSSGSHGFFGNTAGSGGGTYLTTTATFTGAYCSFGTTTDTNNTPTDILAGSRTYNYGNEATLTCSAGRCRTTP